MKPTIDIYIGAPVSGIEASALKQLVEMLSALGEPSLVFANFRCGPAKRQVDYFVVAPSRAAHLELKNYAGPFEAPNKGAWFHKPSGGHRTRIASLDGNPREQAIQTKYAISDAMEQFARENNDAPPPRSGKYYKQFESAVCIYPMIHRDSIVAGGDSRARIWSFEGCVTTMNDQPAVNNWPLDLWRRFATDHLRLEKAPLPAAISPEVYEARCQLEVLCSKQTAYFENLVGGTVKLGPEFCASEHLALVGRKGVGKTTIVQRLAGRAAAEGKLCFFLRAMKYRGDFAKMLQQALAPFSPSPPKDLVRTAELCGAEIWLVLDGVDQVSDHDLREDLLTAAAGFFERHPCTVVITTSLEITVPPNIQGKTVIIPELSQDERQTIYRHYAPDGTAALDLTAFPTPYDLKIAAQAAAKLPNLATPALVYDTYIRLQLGHDIATVGIKVCRAIAHEIFRRFSLFLSHQEFDELAERELSKAGAPVLLTDRIKTSRLFDLDVDGISFAHDLLVHHLVAAEVVHANRENLAALGEIIEQPLYSPLAAEIISRVPDVDVANALLCQLPSLDLFKAAHRGELGVVVKDRVNTLVREVLDRADEELNSLRIECVIPESKDAYPRISPITVEEVPNVDLCALALVAENMDLYFPRVAEMLDRYGRCLQEAVREVAKSRRLRAAALTALYLRSEFLFTKQKLRCSNIAYLLGHHTFGRPKLSPAVVKAFDATFGDGPLNPVADFVLCKVWEGAANPDISKMLALFRKCWSSAIYYLQLQATEMFSMQVLWLTQHAADRVPEVVKELEARLGDNPILNSVLFDLLSRLGSLEPPVSIEAASEEAAELLEELSNSSPNSQNALGITLAQRAYHFLGCIFEEVFSESYFHAYEGLDSESKSALLNAAALDTSTGFNHDWIFEELVKLAHRSSYTLFADYCRKAPPPGGFHVGQSTKLFLASVIGLARIGASLPDWQDENQSPSVAWKTARDLFYNTLVGRIDENAALWQYLESEDPLGGVSVLLHIRCFLGQLEFRYPVKFLPEFEAPASVKRLMEIGLKNFDSIDFGDLDRFSNDPFAMLCRILEMVGDEQTIGLLERLTPDQQKGPDAIRAIRQIKQRLRCPAPL
jgi:hypothetical protein